MADKTSPDDALAPLPGAAPQLDPLAVPLKVLLKRPAVTCAPEDSVRQALETMRQEKVGSILVVDDRQAPVGVFTLRDLCNRVVLENYDVAAPIAGVMSRNPWSLPVDAPALEAALTMAQRSIRHIVLTDEGRLAGVISERDLFSLQQISVARIAGALRQADRLEPLREAAADIRQLARHLMAQGVGAEQLTRLVSHLNDQLACRIIQLVFRDAGLPDQGWCWLALGSEGRLEQTLLTDQDNGLIFADPQDGDVEAMRRRFLPAAQQVNVWLDACGFPLCKGEIMAGNPRWCLSLSEWKDAFGDWIFRGDAPVLLNATIFFDFRPLAGETGLGDDLRAWLNQKVKDSRPFLKAMVMNALGNRPPVGLVRDFVVDSEGDHPGTLDLKVHGTTLFVDAARIFALAAGLGATGTVERLREAGRQWRLDEAEVGGWIEGFHALQQARLRLHQEQLGRNQPMHNHLAPDDLDGPGRRQLKDAFRQAKRLQTKLESYFQY